jgi:undecaprenyl-diphosphatase
MNFIKILLFISVLSNILLGFKLDFKVSKDNSSFWEAHYYVPRYSFIGITGYALYEGSESRLGKTAYKSIEAGIISQVITTGLKDATGRERPRNTDNPNEWNKGGDSFPSGHVSGMTALVTPFILEYKDDYPAVHTLWLLPVYQMIGRVKAQAHWQSDVLAGALVGFASGYYSHQSDLSLLFYFDDDKMILGWKYKF